MNRKKIAAVMLTAIIVPGGIFGLLFWALVHYCNHDFGFPRTVYKKLGNKDLLATAETYVVCLKCAKEFNYDWLSMKVGKQRDRHSHPISDSGTARLGGPASETEGRR